MLSSVFSASWNVLIYSTPIISQDSTILIH